MRGWSFDRTAASGGIAFTALAFASVAVAPAAPAVEADADAIRGYLTDHHDRFGISVAMMALAVVAVALFFGYVHRRLTDTDRGTALPGLFLIASTGVVVTALAGVLLQGVLAQHTGAEVDDSTLLVLHRTWHIVAYMGPPLLMAVALLLAGSRSVRTGVFPRWLGWVAIVSAVGGIVTSLISLGTTTRPPAALDFGSFLLACTWITGVSIHALVKPNSLATPAIVVSAA